MSATPRSWKSARTLTFATVDSSRKDRILVIVLFFVFLLSFHFPLSVSFREFLLFHHLHSFLLFVLDPVTRRLTNVVAATELPAA